MEQTMLDGTKNVPLSTKNVRKHKLFRIEQKASTMEQNVFPSEKCFKVNRKNFLMAQKVLLSTNWQKDCAKLYKMAFGCLVQPLQPWIASP